MPRKPKATRATEAAVPDATPAPARRGRPPRAAKIMPRPTEAEDGSAPAMAAAEIGTTSEPVGMDKTRSEHRDAEAKPAEPAAPSPAADTAAPSKPAARWDAAAGTVQFDWPEIEQTALRPGPNQAMAKLLIAARAEGASSRWPFQAA